MSDPNVMLTKREVINAVIHQLAQARKEGADRVYFDALAIHPMTEDGTTFGQLVDELIRKGE